MRYFSLAHISDAHIKANGRLSYGKVDTMGALKRCVLHLNNMSPRPDAVLISGDLVDFGLPEEYQQFRQVIDELEIPYFAIPGNHDDRVAFRAAFEDQPWCLKGHEPIRWSLNHFPVRIIGLDSSVPGEPWGEISDQDLNWLVKALDKVPNKPTVIALHHHPFICGIDHMDVQNLKNAAALAEVISAYPQVQRILCGHVHRYIVTQFASTVTCVAPGISHQVAPDFSPEGASAFVLEPPGFLLHLWMNEQDVVSHYISIGQFDGPWPFFDKNGLID